MNNQTAKPAPKGAVYYIFSILRGIFVNMGRIIATVVMVGIITGCIVASVMTVYILRYIGADQDIDLESLSLGYTSVIYYTNSDGQIAELQKLYNIEGNRTWVNYEDINQATKDALVAIEDKRFWTHNGVDWRRSFGAFVNLFMPGAASGGGSTVHQQLIKNVTKDDDYRIDRKVREIFRAVELGRKSTHEQVLEAYLNVVPFGNNTNGIQAAAKTYFDKDAKDLTLAEAAAIVGITQKPTAHNPFLYPEKNKERQEYILSQMLEQGLIDQKQHDDAMSQKLNFKKTEYYESITAPQSYFVDHVIEEVIAGLMETKGWTKSYATERLYQDGYRIYTTVDEKIQAHLEAYYLSEENFPQEVYNEKFPQSACTIIDPNGRILGMVGGIGEKTVSRGFNRATMAKRQPGSAIKPIGLYSLSFEYDRITWSTLVDDNPIEDANGRLFPLNFDRIYRGPVTIDYAIQRSVNTVAVKLADALGVQAVYDFLRNSLQMTSLVDSRVSGNRVVTDIAIAPLSLGSLTDGLTPLEMAGGYQMFVNGGNYTKPYAYTQVVDANGKVVLESNTTPVRVISEDTAVVMNRLLQRVTGGPNGTGGTARISGMPTGGKTGTSSDDVDQWFIGFTPYYICQVWLGYDEKTAENGYGQIRYRSYPPPLIFKDIMQPLHEGLEYKEFLDSPDVVSQTYCTITGDLAGPTCDSVGTGWYKKSRLPHTCSGRHIIVEEFEDDGESTGDDEPPRPVVIRTEDWRPE